MAVKVGCAAYGEIRGESFGGEKKKRCLREGGKLDMSGNGTCEWRQMCHDFYGMVVGEARMGNICA